jgi:hypothetical protein
MIHRAPTSIAIQLNNAGAVLLLRGQYNEALTTFAEALKLTKVLLRKRHQTRAARDTSSGKYFHSRSMRLALSQSSLRLRNVVSACSGAAPRRTKQAKTMTMCVTTSMGSNMTINTTRPKIETSNDFVFAEPILVDPQDSVPESPCEIKGCLMKLTVILIFNMALSHHLKAMNSSNESTPSERALDLQRAFSLYELSCKTQVRQGIDLGDIHAMAHVNNLAQIVAASGKKVIARQFFQRLLVHLILYMECTDQEERPRREVEGFIQNTAQLILHDPVLAPAA